MSMRNLLIRPSNVQYSVTAIKAYPLGDPIREGCIQAYIDTVYPMWALAAGISAIAVIVAFFQVSIRIVQDC